MESRWHRRTLQSQHEVVERVLIELDRLGKVLLRVGIDGGLNDGNGSLRSIREYLASLLESIRTSKLACELIVNGRGRLKEGEEPQRNNAELNAHVVRPFPRFHRSRSRLARQTIQ